MNWVLFNITLFVSMNISFNWHIDVLCSISHRFVIDMTSCVLDRFIINMGLNMFNWLKFGMSCVILMLLFRVLMMSHTVVVLIHKYRCWLFNMLNMGIMIMWVVAINKVWINVGGMVLINDFMDILVRV